MHVCQPTGGISVAGGLLKPGGTAKGTRSRAGLLGPTVVVSPPSDERRPGLVSVSPAAEYGRVDDRDEGVAHEFLFILHGPPVRSIIASITAV